MSRRGGINPIAVLILAAVAAGVWWLYTFGPVYWDNLTVRETASAAATGYLTGLEEGVMTRVLTRLNKVTMDGSVGWHFETDEEGMEVRKPGLGISEDQVFIGFDEATRTVTVRITYDRVVEMKPFDKRDVVHFVVEKKTKLQ